MNKEKYNKQLVIANTLYEMGLDIDLIKSITTVKKIDLDKYRQENIDNKDNKLYNNHANKKLLLRTHLDEGSLIVVATLKYLTRCFNLSRVI